MDFDVFNQQTGDRLGLFTVRMFTHWDGLSRMARLQAGTREGSFQIDPTSTPETEGGGMYADFGTTIFTLHA